MVLLATGSNAEVASSARINSGSTAKLRAKHKRCCCPTESRLAGSSQPIFHFLPKSSFGKIKSHRFFNLLRHNPCIRQPYATLSKIDMGRGQGR